MDIDERFWSKVKLEDEAFPENGCMLWMALLRPNGYPNFAVNGLPESAHRWIYKRLRGPIPEGMELDHLCRIRHCVNPDHLQPVTRKENVRRGNVMVRKTHCIRGHLYTEENTMWRAHGVRACRECNRIRNKKYNAEHRYYKGDQNKSYRSDIKPANWLTKPVLNIKPINSAKARQTHCVNGHEFTKENTRFNSSNGTRMCYACRLIRQMKYHAAQRRKKLEDIS